ncbi:hypothetical protein GCM10009844_23610 [Nocardioides koreensis]|uniref:Uncharacterized protein n=1 Tax=Nocardioides koreensis TaxID=433651 RepID=A0ABN2ZU30_9ACTN
MQRSLLAPAAGVTLAVVAWGYLVYAAIDFGATARSGDSQAWFFLVLASVGAVACLFVGLMLVSRLLRRLGITEDPAHPRTRRTRPVVPEPRTADPIATHASSPTPPPAPVRPAGGRRASR